MIVGYRRVSSVDQHLDRQMLGDDCERIFEDKASGKDTLRPGLQEMLTFVRSGDEIRVWSIDRLGRSLSDLHELVATMTAKGVTVAFLAERLVFSADEHDAFKTLQFQLLGAFAQFERAITERRRLEGIQAAKVAGRYKSAGRKRKEFDINKAREMRDAGKSIREIAKALSASKSTVHTDLKPK